MLYFSQIVIYNKDVVIQYGKGGDNNLRDWLKEARAARGFTQQEISERLGISIAHYCMIETGKRKERMDIQLANKLA